MLRDIQRWDGDNDIKEYTLESTHGFGHGCFFIQRKFIQTSENPLEKGNQMVYNIFWVVIQI
jgi:hypothetical protein